MARGRWGVALLGASLLLLSCAPLAAGPNASPVTQQVDGPARQLIGLTNLSRTSNGLSSLPADVRLNAIAQARSQDMIDRRYFSHSIPPDDRTVVDIIESLGVRFRAGSENIAFNDALDFISIQEAQNDFMNSSIHRVNVLNGRWHRLGAGTASGANRKMYTVVFLELPAEAAGQGAPPFDRGRGAISQRLRAPGDLGQVRTAPAGLMDSLVNRSIRLFLSL